ncbi:unnamed protein product [Phaedon cochleariae]|uniref:Uncharacterized protein n=1 Tax=Phaedon cochleariae TaxID=80249 RepID=A0A9N9SE76_PHACE|nr:unnamed protein product [Phaedon cochleariae]
MRKLYRKPTRPNRITRKFDPRTFLSREGRPTVAPTNKSITALYGQPLTLTMEFCANPRYTKVIWIAKDQKIYKPGDADECVIAYGITD